MKKGPSRVRQWRLQFNKIIAIITLIYIRTALTLNTQEKLETYMYKYVWRKVQAIKLDMLDNIYVNMYIGVFADFTHKVSRFLFAFPSFALTHANVHSQYKFIKQF